MIARSHAGTPRSTDDKRDPTLYPFKSTWGGLLEVKVGRIIDGDTVMVSHAGIETVVRLDSIDCPEDGQDWGDCATEGLSKLLTGRHAYLELHGNDVHGRTLATVYVMYGSELINVNERMVMQGHAWVMPRYYGHVSRGRKWQLNRIERWARSKRVGLWKTKNPIPPWLWRNRRQA